MDTEYLSQYQQGITYYDGHVEEIARNLSANKCVAVCSLPKIGNKSLLAYLAFKLPLIGNFVTYHDEKGEFTISTLKTISAMSTEKKKVIVLPYFEDREKEFLEDFNTMMRYRQNNFLTIIRVHADFLENPTKLFPITTWPFEATHILQPFKKNYYEEMVRVRSELLKVQLPTRVRELIIHYCGGHVGLVKRACVLYGLNQSLTLDSLLSDPAIISELMQLEYCMRSLREETLIRVGLYKDNGEVLFPLLTEFVARLQERASSNLSPQHKQLLSLLLKRQEKPVSLREIHQELTPQDAFSLWKLYKIMERFAPAVSNKYLLRNAKGKGYYLIERNV